jgi:hypothetical protein
MASLTNALELWKDKSRLIQSKDAQCKVEKDEIDAEKAFQKQNAAILKWITASSAFEQHERALEEKKVDSDFATCGQWLIDTIDDAKFLTDPQYQSGALWLSGTRTFQHLRNHFKYANVAKY